MASAEQTAPDKNKNVDVMNIKELDPLDFEKRFSVLNTVFFKCADLNEQHSSIRQQLGCSYNFKMRSEARRLKSFLSYNRLSSWSPEAMASAGFYFTGLELSVQCFCCGLVFCTSSIRTPPLEDHKKHNPTCDFIQGRDVGNIPKYEVRIQHSEHHLIQSEEFTAEESRLNSFSGWPFYSKVQPSLLSCAGFFFTGMRDIVQCFSCHGCLGNWDENDDPFKEHAKWFPECHFITSKKTPDEIKQYTANYIGFSEFTGKHFAPVPEDRILPTITQTNLSIFEDESVRLDSYRTWLEHAHVDPASLARAGFYYTGVTDSVRCFTCGVGIYGFEEGEDPTIEHQKHSPKCIFLSKKIKEQQNENQSPQHLERKLCTTASDMMVPDMRWINEVITLQRQLVKVYCDAKFTKLTPFGHSSHVSLDLKNLFADIFVTTKDTRNHSLEQLTLPDILSDLQDITLIEGEAGCGKTALLKKIAILWASGCCPVLSRFKLVFYICVPLAGKEQTLSEIIREQLVGCPSTLTEEHIGEILKHFENQILFLVDDYGVMDFVPKTIEELILKSHWNRTSVSVTVRTDRRRKLRQYARTILSIHDFPLYSSIYICRQLFSHDMSRVEEFLLKLISSKTFQSALKTPLFTLALCVFWVQNPKEKISSDLAVSKVYLLHIMLKYSKENEKLEKLVCSCGELALRGLLQSCFQFTDEDLSAACVNSDDALKVGLISKFTSQRLQARYAFFHPSFQEFLAAKWMSDLLDSSDTFQKGISFLQQIDTFLKVFGRFFYLLKYSCTFSPKIASLIISHLFSLLNNSEAFDCQTDNNIHLEHHPDLICVEQMLTLIISKPTSYRFAMVTHVLLRFSIEASYEGNSLVRSAPIILQFLKGKELTVEFASTDMTIYRFLKDYPQAFALIRSLKVSIQGVMKAFKETLFRKEDLVPYWGFPTVEQDYSSAFQLLPDTHKEINDHRWKKCIDLSVFNFTRGDHNISLLKVEAAGEIIEWETVISNLSIFSPLTNQIELEVAETHGFIGRLKPCIEKYRDTFVKCSLYKVELTLAEQELILEMTSLRCLRIACMQPPDLIIRHLDRFHLLKELTLDLSTESKIIEILPDGFRNLHFLEKIFLNNISLKTHSFRLAQLLGSFSNLTSFHLNCEICPEFEKIVAALSQNGNIQEIRMQGFFAENQEIAILATFLPLMTKLTVLDIEVQRCDNQETIKKFVEALPFVEKLEVLKLPSGPAIKEMAIPIILQFQYLPNLTNLHFTNNSLDDLSLLELAKISREGHLRSLQTLDLSVNHDITQPGWRDFFQTLDNLPVINHLSITRIYTYQFKTDPLTLKALVQCVSRLHSLTFLVMHGWLLDDKDLKMFNAMKENHPKAKSFQLIWQWISPICPVVIE